MARSHKLRIAPKLALPLESVVESFAWLGIRGSGKTYGASVLAEEVHAIGAQFVFVDPTDGAWGFKSSADGQGQGLPVYIFGGSHADVPLEPTAGALIADVIVESGISAVLSLRHMRKADQHRFMTAFCEQLYHRKGEAAHRTPLHVFIDEAHAFAPQQVRGDVARMVGAVEDLGRMGRNTGIGLSLISQRPASVNKNVLTQAETLVAFRILHQLDRKAIDGWIEAHDTEGRRDEFMASLASLADGEAWVWSPKLDLFERVRIRARRTFDSSATPKPGEVRIEPEQMAAVDIEKLGQRITETVERAEANDPRKLQTRVAQLERELTQARQAAEAGQSAPEPVIERVEVPIFSDEHFTLLTTLRDALQGLATEHAQGLSQIAEGVTRLSNQASAAHDLAQRAATPPAKAQSAPPPRPAPPLPRPAVAAPLGNGSEQPAEGLDGLRKGERRILEELVSRYPAVWTRAQVGTLTGFAPRGGTFTTYIGVLRRRGLLELTGREVCATEYAVSLLGAPPPPVTHEEVMVMWGRNLRAGERRMLEIVADRGDGGIDRVVLAELAGFAVSGGTFGTYLGVLRRNGLIETEGEVVRACDVLWPERAH